MWVVRLVLGEEPEILFWVGLALLTAWLAGRGRVAGQQGHLVAAPDRGRGASRARAVDLLRHPADDRHRWRRRRRRRPGDGAAALGALARSRPDRRGPAGPRALTRPPDFIGKACLN